MNKSDRTAFSSSRPTRLIRDTAIVIFIVVSMVCSVEVFFYLLNRSSGKVVTQTWETSEDYLGTFLQHSSTLGYTPRPSSRLTTTHKIADTLSYTATYTIDSRGRRSTPGPKNGTQERFLLFFGCSFTFGEGVQDNETMPFFVAQKCPDTKVYNYGFLGYGPQQMLSYLADPAFAHGVEESTGTAVYTFIDDHVKRAVGTMRVAGSWGEHFPLYKESDTGHLTQDGSFSTGRPLVAFMYKLLSKSQVVAYFNLDFPRIGDRHIRFVAKIVKESKDLFKEKFGSDDFYVLFFPGCRYTKRLARYLNQYGIRSLDYSSLFQLKDPAYTLDLQGHPNAAAYRLVSEKLVTESNLCDRKE